MLSKKNILYRLIIQNSFKQTLIYLYNSKFEIIKQWSIKTKKRKKFERRKNTKYNLLKLVRNVKYFLFKNKIIFLEITFIGTNLAHKHFLNFLLDEPSQVVIIRIKDKTLLPFNGCRAKKKKRK